MQAALDRIGGKLSQTRSEAVKAVFGGQEVAFPSVLAAFSKEAILQLATFVTGEKMFWLKEGEMPQEVTLVKDAKDDYSEMRSVLYSLIDQYVEVSRDLEA